MFKQRAKLPGTRKNGRRKRRHQSDEPIAQPACHRIVNLVEVLRRPQERARMRMIEQEWYQGRNEQRQSGSRNEGEAMGAQKPDVFQQNDQYENRQRQVAQFYAGAKTRGEQRIEQMASPAGRDKAVGAIHRGENGGHARQIVADAARLQRDEITAGQQPHPVAGQPSRRAKSAQQAKE